MKDILCDGFYSPDNGKYLINLSSINSHLIRECGRLVEDYNSDLLYDLESIRKYASEFAEDETKVFWIGFRESGVDHKEFIECRCENDYFYRGVYRISVRKTARKCEVKMQKSSLWDFRKEYGIFK